MHNEILAKALIEAIRKMASNEGCLDNFENYLSHHFDKWYEKYANTPEGLTEEFEMFATMNL